MAALLLQQAVNGLSLGAMYALLALGFTLVYGILELINFAHFNVFMVGSFIGLWTLQALRAEGSGGGAHGSAARGGPRHGIRRDHARLGHPGCRHRARRAEAAPRGARAGRDDHDDWRIDHPVQPGPAPVGADSENYPNPLPRLQVSILGATVRLQDALVWAVALLLMAALHLLVRRTRLGKAMRAAAQDAEAARMMGVDVDRVVMAAFFLGSALAGAAGLIFGLYYEFTSFLIGFTAGLRAFTAAVLGGIGSVPGAMVGGVLIGLIEAFGGQFIGAAWADVVIFSILVLVLVLRPAGLFGQMAPSRS